MDCTNDLSSFSAGSVPLLLSLSQEAINLTSLVGTGVLLGSALAVIIPEGVETIYSPSIAEAPGKRSVVEMEPYTTVHWHWTAPAASEHTFYRYKRKAIEPQKLRSRRVEDEPDPHVYVGLALLSGYLLMFLIDQATHSGSTPSAGAQYIAVDNLSELHDLMPNGQGRRGEASERRSLSTSIGLIIHSTADGIALGASAHASAALSSIVFFAMMLHKAPAAFGLTAVLLKQTLTKRQIRLHLAGFSLAAPLGALLTYGFINSLKSRMVGEVPLNGIDQHSAFYTGFILLFSGGTFLYVAASHVPKEGMRFMETLAVLGGMVLPLVFGAFGHNH